MCVEDMDDRAVLAMAEYVARVQKVAADRERAAIVAWLIDMDQPALAKSVGHGKHLRGDDE